MTEQKYLKVFILLLEQTIDLGIKLSVLHCFVHGSELFSLHTNSMMGSPERKYVKEKKR